MALIVTENGYSSCYHRPMQYSFSHGSPQNESLGSRCIVPFNRHTACVATRLSADGDLCTLLYEKEVMANCSSSECKISILDNIPVLDLSYQRWMARHIVDRTDELESQKISSAQIQIHLYHDTCLTKTI